MGTEVKTPLFFYKYFFIIFYAGYFFSVKYPFLAVPRHSKYTMLTTLTVQVPYAKWFYCQQFLAQNYIMPMHDYKFTLLNHAYTIEFYRSSHYSTFIHHFPFSEIP